MNPRTGVRERPILFSGPMVNAILDGRKTMTRRVVKGVYRPDEPPLTGVDCIKDWDGGPSRLDWAPDNWEICPYGQPGDRLWVREAWATTAGYDHCSPGPECDPYYYRADGDDVPYVQERGRWRPSIHMPRWVSRITLELTGVRVERLQAITEDDAFREGFECRGYHCDVSVGHVDCGGVARFRELWDQLNAKRGLGWAANRWVWVLGFRWMDSRQLKSAHPADSAM